MIGVSIACAKVAAKVSEKEIFEYLTTLMEIKPSRKVPYLFMNLLVEENTPIMVWSGFSGISYCA